LFARAQEHYEMGSTYRLSRRSVTDTGTPGKERRKSKSRGKSKVVEKIEQVKDYREVEGEVEVEGEAEGEMDGGALTMTALKTSASTGVLWGDTMEWEGSAGEQESADDGVVDVTVMREFAMTRPPGPNPSPKKGATTAFFPETPVLPSPLLESVGAKKGGAADGRQLVTFKRPTKSAGLFIDPTFVDNQPITEQDIDDLGNRTGKPRLMSAKSLTAGRKFEEVEAYSHTVDIMGSKVQVHGTRIAGPGGILDDEGNTRVPVTFDNVHTASVARELHKLRLDQEE
jgi:hypothetical protein